jgi:hypothetical protein
VAGIHAEEVNRLRAAIRKLSSDYAAESREVGSICGWYSLVWFRRFDLLHKLKIGACPSERWLSETVLI